MKTSYWILIALFVTCLCDAQSPAHFVAKLEPVPPFSTLQTFAKARSIQLDGFGEPVGTNLLHPTTLAVGDSLVMLVSLHEKGRWRTQWLIYLQVADSQNDSSGASNRSPSKSVAPKVVYTSAGNQFAFAHTPAVIQVRTIGPFVDSNSHREASMLTDKTASITVNQTYLALGLDGASEVLHRLYALRAGDTNLAAFSFGISQEPYTSPQISRGRMMAARLKITPAEERSLAGGVVALFSYFNTVQQTPELASILFKVLSLPSVWSMVHHLGITPGIRIGHPADRDGPLALSDWNMPPGMPLYALPVAVTLNEHPALTLTLIVTVPRPPFLAGGGIVGFLAENPDDPENYLTLRVIAARSGAGVVGRRQQPVVAPGNR